MSINSKTGLRLFTLALGFSLLGFFSTSDAARKYYPPGFTPPSEQKPVPVTPTPSKPEVIIQPVAVPGGKQVIIKTVAQKPRDPLAVLLDERRFYDALRLVDTRLKKTPNDVALLVTRGNILREQGDFPAAIQQFQSLAEKNRLKPVRATALGGLGRTWYEKSLSETENGDAESGQISMQTAETTFKQALALSPSLGAALAGYGELQLAQGHLEAASKTIQKAVKLAGSNPDVQLANVRLLLARHKPEDALQLLYGIKKTTTRDPDVYLLLAQASLATNRVDDAIINLKQLLELVPEHTEGLKLLSRSYELKMKPEDAQETLEKAITLNPADKKSVEALLKIYDQRNEGERSVLLLKKLLKDKPGTAFYAEALMKRLALQGQWDGLYTDSLGIIGPVLTNRSETPEDQEAVASLFAKGVYNHARGMLDPHELLKDPAVQQVVQFSLARLQQASQGDLNSGLTSRLNLLLLDPLVSLPQLPADFQPSPDSLGTALQIAFLEGDSSLYDRLLKAAGTSGNRLGIARALLDMGDYHGAESLADGMLAASPNAPDAMSIKQSVTSNRKHMDELLNSLSMLPRKISDSYWEKAASEALKVGNADWKTHAMVADALEKRRQPKLALLHQKLAAQFAPTEKERQVWLKRADRTARTLAGKR